MRLSKLMKPAGAALTAGCALVTGIALNLSILAAGPEGAGNLSLGTRRATTTTAAARRVPPPTMVAARDPRVVLEIAEVTPVAEVTAPPSWPASSASSPSSAPRPLDGGAGGGAAPPATATTTAPPSVATSTSSSIPPLATTTTVRDPQRRTYRVARAGTVSTALVEPRTVVVTAHPARGWTVRLERTRGPQVTATFRRRAVRIVWRVRVERGELRVTVRRFVERSRR